MSNKQIKWIKKMVSTIDEWVHPDDMSHVWNTKYKHIKYMLKSGYLVNHMAASGYHTSLVIAFLEDACNKAKANHQEILDIKLGY